MRDAGATASCSQAGTFDFLTLTTTARSSEARWVFSMYLRPSFLAPEAAAKLRPIRSRAAPRISITRHGRNEL
ncbi:hypothetical protein [Rathayibacter tanaceti]|uniref:Uncharacterized protein n=1 Tax=Rathayibacter tanaceti TaxID=1671680 RepID=A0A166HXF3_9MICO|nr:hypothetical protein [Rathayibacter tanaceti]KZX21301.1 hypothetical protein ACH61_01576 [Rathayibacter tanaceti]